MKSLPTGEQSCIRFRNSSKPFWFGDGKQLKSEQLARIPATVGQHKVNIKTDIIESDIPLHLSKSATKKAQIQITFDNGTIAFLGEEVHGRVA